ncbi:PTS sugar transporter subunit IIA domain-containing protein [Halomonas denitrificans]|nr:hypothetical protein [Halomonas denitrificans]
MTRCLVVGHSGLAAALVRVAREIVGPEAGCEAFDFFFEQTLERIEADLARWLDEQLDRGPAVLLTDLPGATPHNLSVKLAGSRGLEVVTGVNLPMLLRGVNHADTEPAELARMVAAGGLRAIERSAADRSRTEGSGEKP